MTIMLLSSLMDGLTYRFNEWMRSNLNYNTEVFDSNKGNIDYKLNRVMLGLSVGY